MQPINVLLVDDDENYHTLIQKMLARDASRFKLRWVSSFEMAKSVAAKSNYDVFLVDYRLGEHNGLELLSAFRESGLDAPFILMTGYSDQEFDQQVIDAGVSDYIDKADLKPGILMRTIRYAWQRARDIRALRDSEQNYRMLLDNASDGIIITDQTGKIVIANQTVADLIGVEPEALISQLIHEYILGTPRHKAVFPVLESEPDTVIREQRLRLKNGKFLPIEVSAKHITQNRIQCIFRDITHRKAAESERDKYIQRLTILQQIEAEINQQLNLEHVMALALDAAVRLSVANAGFISTYDNGQLRLEQAIGRYSQFKPGDYLPKNKLIEELITSHKPRLILDPAVIKSEIATVEDTSAQMLIPLMSYERLLGVLNLETNRADRFNEDTFDFIKLIASRVAVAMENAQLYQIAQDQLAQVQELYSQVSELEQLKTDMIRIAAHDLRNPVGVIVGYLELLEWSLGDQLTDKQRSQMEAMTRAAYRMEKITTDILSLERIEKLHLDNTQTLNLNEMLTETFEEYETQALDKHQTITLEMTDEKLVVQADHAQIREATSNLISNAIKYTPVQGKITVKLQREGNAAVLKVMDTGYGIPEDQQIGLFQPFYRAKSDETAEIDGTGLGLHLVKNIITRHDGEMVFSSKYGEGSTFGFRLPVV